ncbi:MAG: polyprenyl synthetase family protein [Pikeienuella sp.]
MILTPAETDRFTAALISAADRASTTLDNLLPPVDDSPLGRVAAAMRHGALGGGKRLRAFLVIEAAMLTGGTSEQANRVAAAIECLHAYSLIHDDLPCMDDDDMRRGLPTVHKKWDEETAVLAGDALQTIAFEILAGPDTHDDATVRADLCLRLARASGALGMVGGQMIDIAAETAETPLTLPQIEQLQSLKTGALIKFSAEAGALLGKPTDSDLNAISKYACDLGSAFQIRDDILDIEGDAAVAGKALRKDADAGKATFVNLLGLEGARTRADELANAAADHLAKFGPAADALCLAAKYSVCRRS